jgi:acyl-CoA reductase-like NAD-dependent aldehyde dehydrogenase
VENARKISPLPWCATDPVRASPSPARRASRESAIDYGVTAGVFSRDDAEIERFLDEIEAGVVYVNRRAGATTGAWPGFQSFCGWKSSGSTGKGGLGP